MAVAELIRIDPSNADWETCADLYFTSFPPDERRESDELIKVSASEGYFFYMLTEDDAFIGILELWEFDDFIFIEHLAISPQFRSQGKGSGFMKSLLDMYKKPVLLEAELPYDEVSTRRIKFYNNLTFTVLDVDYSQPPYYPGKKSVPMLLFSNKEFHKSLIPQFINTITNNVYKNI